MYLCAVCTGINKPDVRFVVHYSLPKSLTHYYQESGRAGRDGERADCIMYYSYKDKRILEMMIRKGANEGPRAYSRDNAEKIRNGIDNLYKCVSFCANEVDCRRALVLAYFGEHFDRKECRGTCDNCRNEQDVEEQDMTQEAVKVLNLLQEIGDQTITLCQLMSIFRGENAAFVRKRSFDQLQLYGSGSHHSKIEAERLLQQMVLHRFLDEETCELSTGFSAEYVKEGPDAHALRSGKKALVLTYRTTNKGRKKRKSGPAKKDFEQSDVMIIEDLVSDEEELIFSGPQDDKAKEGSASKARTKRPRKQRDIAETYRVTKQVAAQLETSIVNWREKVAVAQRTQYWNVLGRSEVKYLSCLAPTTMEELEAIPGFGGRLSPSEWSLIVSAL
jgi:superfamily II DNA helicase RecQ